MRKIRRWWRRFWGGLRIRKRRNEVAEALRLHFNLPSLPLLAARGSRGNDSTYLVSHSKTILGMLRLVNPHSSRGGPSTPMPYQLELGAARIDREWKAYLKGYAAGLTPKPLWRTDDALLCEYLPCRPLQEDFSGWETICGAARALQALHQTGLTHMDASCANILNDKAGGRLVFIDFEYTPTPETSPAAQRVYDHLALLESSWKFIPEEKHGDYAAWLDYFKSCLDDDMRRVNLAPLKPALTRVLNAPVLGAKIRQSFY
jgi:hypothetical protein